MIGLTFLAIGLLWLALSVFVGRKLPQWIGIRNPAEKWAVTVVAVAVLLIGPFVDEIIGMKQFEKLCAERTVIRVSADAKQVTRARRISKPRTELNGYWINIRSTAVIYVDADTDREFLRYEILNTSGGRVAGLALLGGSHQCVPKDYGPANDLDLDKLLKEGNKK